MPDFLDKFINETLPELWDKVIDFWNESTTNEIIIAAAALVCLILAIAVHKANRRDRKYNERAANQAAGEIASAPAEEQQESVQTEGEEEPVQAAAEDVTAQNAEQEELLQEDRAVDESEFGNNGVIANETDGIKAAQTDNMHPIVMEKIELKREEHHPSVMSYNTSRKGTTFTEEQLKKIIKD